MEQQYQVLLRRYSSDGSVILNSTLSNKNPPNSGYYPWALACIHTARIVLGEMVTKYDAGVSCDIWMEPL